MNTFHQIEELPQPDDHPDRLLDVALAELVGGAAPPDLSSRIAATTSRQPAAVGPVPRTRQDRAFWVNLAVAVMLLIGVTILLLPEVQSARERNHGAVSNVATTESSKQLHEILAGDGS